MGQLEFVAPGARDTMNSLALVTIACLLTATQAVKMTSNVPLFDWVSTEHVLDGLSASKDELDASSFLQYVVGPDTGVDFKQWKDLDVRSLKEQGCDGSFDCSLYSEKKTFGFEGDKEDPYYVPAKQAPEVKFPSDASRAPLGVTSRATTKLAIPSLSENTRRPRARDSTEPRRAISLRPRTA